MTCCNCQRPFVEHCTIHVIPCCPGKCLGSTKRPSFFVPDDSYTLSEIDRGERRRAMCLAIAILCLLIAAACIYFAQS